MTQDFEALTKEVTELLKEVTEARKNAIPKKAVLLTLSTVGALILSAYLLRN